MIPLAGILGGSGGFSGSSSASSDLSAGGVSGFGTFNFQPKGGSLPQGAWIAIAVVGVAMIVWGLKGRRR